MAWNAIAQNFFTNGDDGRGDIHVVLSSAKDVHTYIRTCSIVISIVRALLVYLNFLVYCKRLQPPAGG